MLKSFSTTSYTLLLSISLLSPLCGLSQFGFLYEDNIPVKVNGNTLNNAWAGGINYAQISDFDYDFDGDLDLFIFDISHNNIRVFTQENDGSGSYYKHAYNAKSKFPPNLLYKGLLYDFDNDGRKDLFTQGLSGLKVYRNVGDATNGLQWVLFDELLESQYPNNYSNLYVSSSDIPALVDVDQDGDMDILTFHQGGRRVEYHQNQSMDLYGIPDSLKFELRNECWGKFTEDVNTNDISLNDPNFPCVGGQISNPEMEITQGSNLTSKPRHAGSTLLALDMDNSGVLDLVLGDVSFTNMNLLMNGGTAVNTDSPMISVDASFPSNTTPVSMHLFPAGYFIDVDFDGTKDLVVTPNARNVSENEASVLFYKNHGTNELPNFIFTRRNHLQNEIIDHGTGSVPVFVDLDEDGLKDMVIANFFRYKPVLNKESTIAWYKNTGTANAPEYTFIDGDYANLSSQNYGLRSIPAFGDLDNDGDQDMLLGIENGSLIYYENTSTGSGAVFSTGVINYADNTGSPISSGGYCHPQLYDLNKDGLIDLIIGRRDGTIMYYENTGTSTSPSFTLSNSQLGNIDVSTTTPDGYAAPHFFEVNGETQLFLGSIDGKLNYYAGIDGHLNTGDSFIFHSNHYLDIDVEYYSSFWVEDIDGDSNLNMFVGQELGGLFHFEADPNSHISVEEIHTSPLIALYPNPFKDEINISVSSGVANSYQLFDSQGRLIKTNKITNNTHTLKTEMLQTGIYFVSIQLENGQNSIKKIIKR